MNDVIGLTLVSGSIAAGILGISHSYMKPLNLHQVLNYIYGSAINLATAFFALSTRVNWTFGEVIILLGGIWGISGGTVMFTYLLDYSQKAQRKRAQLAARNEGVKKGDGK